MLLGRLLVSIEEVFSTYQCVHFQYSYIKFFISLDTRGLFGMYGYIIHASLVYVWYINLRQESLCCYHLHWPVPVYRIVEAETCTCQNRLLIRTLFRGLGKVQELKKPWSEYYTPERICLSGFGLQCVNGERWCMEMLERAYCVLEERLCGKV